MNKLELVTLLNQYPDDIEIKFLANAYDMQSEIQDFDEENILHTSETAILVGGKNEDDPDTVELGNGKQFLLINPIIV